MIQIHTCKTNYMKVDREKKVDGEMEVVFLKSRKNMQR